MSEDIQRVRNARTVAKRTFTRKCNLFEETVNQEGTKAVLTDICKEVCDAFVKVEKCHEEYLTLLVQGGEKESVIEEAESYINESERKKIEVLCTQRRLCGENETEKEAEKNKAIKVKSIQPPVFSGDVREYPNFKEDYKRLMNSNFNKDPYALRSCLSGAALSAVQGVENDYDKIFQRLDEKFGDSCKLVDAVLSDLKSIKPISEGDNKGFVRMVEKYERCWLDMKRMNLEREMNTASMVNIVEKVMPGTQRREWVIASEKHRNSDNIFEVLMEFLLREKRVLEYMDSSVRSNVNCKSVCHNANGEIVESKDDMNNTIQKLQEDQGELRQCLNRLTQSIQHLGKVRSEGEPLPWQGSKCWLHDSNTHSLQGCREFKEMSSSERMKIVKSKRICFKCLNGSHVSKRCQSSKCCNVLTSDGHRCGKDHHGLLHEAYVAGLMFHTSMSLSSESRLRDKALLMMSKLYSKNCPTPLNTLWDPGSDITLVRSCTATRLGLSGREVTLSVTKVGRKTERLRSREYVIPLVDLAGKIWNVIAYGIEDITSSVCRVDFTKMVELFEGITVSDLDRPEGDIDLLIGTDRCNLMPQVVSSVGNLQLMQNMFGFCVRGSHPLVKFESREDNVFSVRVNHMACVAETDDIIVEDDSNNRPKLETFFEIEGLGTYCVPKCGGCKCGSCAVGDKNYSIKEEKELALINAGLNYNPDEKRWTVRYPWIKDPKELPNNVSVAVAKMKSTERRLTQLGPQYASLYNSQIQDMSERQVARKLSIKEINSYEGPVHYVHHHEVFKPSSSSTPLRIVFNSSASYKGHCLNDYWAKGPDVLNSLLGILVRFRQGRVGFTGDISKMYNSVKLGILEQHTHRFLWRDMDTNRPPDHYVATAVAFGDKPSGVIAMTAIHKTVERCAANLPEIKNIMCKNTYVDDIVHSCDDTHEALELMNNINLVLAEGGFKIKHWLISGNEIGNSDLCLLDSREEKVLGLNWNPKEDKFSYKVKLNFSKKFRNVREGPCLTISDLKEKIPKVLTKRTVLSQVAAVYDPLGLIAPFTLTPKLLMREIIISEKDRNAAHTWDDPLSDRFRAKWCNFFYEMYELENLTFDRCIKPSDAVGDPMLVIFSDASSLAYGACAYVRWKQTNGYYHARLIMAKNRIAPIKKITIPRLELCGAVLSCRLRLTLEKESDWKFQSVMHIVDSSIVRAQIQKESYGFGTFVANRIAEIQAKTDPNDWWWVSTSENPADLTTRPCHPNYLHTYSLWQKGPDFLADEICKWPISKSCSEELPDRVSVTLACASRMEPEPEPGIVNIERYSSYNKLLRVIARVMAAVKSRSFKAECCQPNPGWISEAEKYLIRQEQKALQTDWKRAYQRLGPSMNNDGIIVVGERMAKWLKENWNQESFVLMPPSSQVVKLYIKHLHEIDHGGVESTLAKLQGKFWVPSARRLIKTVKVQCVICRRLEAMTATQRMGQVISERLKPTPPFYYTALDLFGPFAIKDTVKRRTIGKAYGVIFNCLVTRAVYLDLVDTYNTQSFLTAFRRFVSLRGYPHTIHSDSGTQLVAASKELKVIRQTWDMTKIMDSSANKGITWIFNKSADAPWQNGCSEALIRLVKRALVIAIGDSRLTFGELQTVLFETANLLNNRPIGMKPGVDVEMGSYLCPNDLLLGRNNVGAPTGKMLEQCSDKSRLVFMDHIVSSFWKKWQRDYFPTLIVRQKWHVDRRNVCPDDIVLLQDTDGFRGHWRLAQVKSVKQSRDGRVRDVVVCYKIKRPGIAYKGQDDVCVNRSVHKLVVILPVEEFVTFGAGSVS